MSLAGDLNGDGRADAIARCNAGTDGPAAYMVILFGSTTGLVASAPYYAFSDALTRAGDLDGDGYDDVLHASGATRRVLRGGASGLTPSPAVFSSGAFAVGDVNGDGYDDLAESIGAAVQIYLGSAAGVSAVASRTVALP